MIIDTHTHAIPESFIRYIEKKPGSFGTTVIQDEFGKKMLSIQGIRRQFPLFPEFYDLEKRLADMDDRHIDLEWSAVPPFLFNYGLSTIEGIEVSTMLNDGLAEMAAVAPNRISPLANVPLQDVEASCKELKRVVEQYGFKGVQIGTSIEGRYYDELEFLPFFQLCEDLGLVILFHPYNLKATAGPMTKYYLSNFIGNPLDTTICIAMMAFGGIMMKYPRLKLIFVHAGGFMPYQRGRFEHGHSRRQEGRVIIGDTPLATFFDNIYYDIITHNDDALRFLISAHGSRHVVLGTDYPFDMAEDHPVERLEGLGSVSDRELEDILSKNALLLTQESQEKAS